MAVHKNRKELRSLILFFAFLGAVIYWFVPSSDGNLSAAECDMLNARYKTQYSKQFIFDTSWDFENFECNSPESAMVKALHFIETTKFDLPGTEVPFDFFKWAVTIKPVFSSSIRLTGSAFAYYADRRIDISSLQLEGNNPVGVSTILIHELRHLDEGADRHVPCTDKPTTGCDAKLSKNLLEGGSYNYNVMHLHRLLTYADLTGFQRHTAKILLKRILETKINRLTLEDRNRYLP